MGIRQWLCKWLCDRNESFNGTTVDSIRVTITDVDNAKWALVHSAFSEMQVTRNGVVDLRTTAVIRLLYWNHRVYQQTHWGWWFWYSGAWLSVDHDPRPSNRE